MNIAISDPGGPNGTDEPPGPSTASSLITALMLNQQASSSKQKCAFCTKSLDEGPVQPCLFCGSISYCSLEHQKLDWVSHKMMCHSLTTRGLVPSNLMPQTTQPSAIAPPVFTESALTTSLLLSLQQHQNPFLVQSQTPTFSIVTSPKIDIPSTFPSENSAFKPYRSTHVFNSLSSESVSSMAMSNETSLDHMSNSSLAMFPTSSTTQSDISRLASQVLKMGNELAVVASTSTSSTVPVSKEPKEKIILTDDPDIQIIETIDESSSSTSKPTRTRKRPTPSSSVDPNIKIKDHNKNIVYSVTLQEHQKHLQNRGLALNIHQAMVLRLRYIAEHVIRSLNEYGWAVVDNFLGSDHYKYTALEIERLHKRGLFSPGQLMEGKNKDEMHIKDIRSDHIYWYDGRDERAKDAATVRLLISMIDSVIQHFKNRIAHEIGGRSRAMLAIYPGNGTRYVKHVDNPVKDGRCITTIYYCNENWDMVKDGGTLRLYPETSLTPMDVDPRADRLVFFWSDRRNPHEVMPVHRPRFAITIWYMDRAERDKALSKGKEESAACATSKKENDPSSSSPSSSQLGTPTRPRKNPSSHDLSKLDLRLFPSTSSDPALISAGEEKVLPDNDFQSTSSLAHPESTDSGVCLSTILDHHHHHHLERTSSLQSISDHFRSERSTERRSSTSDDQDLDEGLPPAPSTNPEYMI